MSLPPRLRSSVRQEKSIARDAQGRRQAGSGNQTGSKGDVSLAEWLVEAKTTVTGRYVLKVETWRKIEAEAILARKEAALVVSVAGRQLVVIDYNVWLGILGQ